ncbi:sulfite exporter TauE/SafE family protein [Listeria aquatica]
MLNTGENMTGILYFFVIIFANMVGAISGMGGGVIIKPILDLIGRHSVAAISFYSSTAVFTMAIVSTFRQIKSGGIHLNMVRVLSVSGGAIVGGILGNVLFDYLLGYFGKGSSVQLVQIILTIITLVFAFLYSRYEWKSFHLHHLGWYIFCGIILGFLASLLGIGGGPINVSLLMLMFAMPIKEAAVYSICTILFSQFAKLTTIATTTGFLMYDLSMLFFVIPAAFLGGLLGAKISNILSPDKVTIVFQSVILVVLLINIYNGWLLLK